MSIFDKFVREFYEDYLEGRRGHGVCSVDDAWIALEPVLIAAVSEGRLDVDLKAAGQKSLKAADRSITDRGKRIFKRELIRAWEGQLSLDDGAWLHVLIPLGGNDRVHVCDMGLDEYDRAHNLRHENKIKVDFEYYMWVKGMAPFVTHFHTGLTVGQIVARGLVTADDLDWGDDGTDPWESA